MRNIWFLILVVLVPTFFVELAAAACPNQCTLEVEDPQVEPTLECVELRSPGPQECDCKVVVYVRNSCDKPVLASGFSFTWCGDERGPCSEIAPGDEGTISEPLTETGEMEHSFSIQVGETTAKIVTKTDVDSFEEGGCSYARSESRAPRIYWTIIFLVGVGRIVSRKFRVARNVGL